MKDKSASIPESTEIYAKRKENLSKIDQKIHDEIKQKNDKICSLTQLNSATNKMLNDVHKEYELRANISIQIDTNLIESKKTIVYLYLYIFLSFSLSLILFFSFLFSSSLLSFCYSSCII